MNRLILQNKTTTVSNYVLKNFPNKNSKIGDVCSGTNALLTKKLKELGYKYVIPIDPILNKKIDGIHDKFTPALCENFDLIISIWSCDFTDDLIKICRKSCKTLLLLPCSCSTVDGKKEYGLWKYSKIVRKIRKTYYPLYVDVLLVKEYKKNVRQIIFQF